MVSYSEPGARHPLRDWLLQRLTAVVMLLCTLVFFAALAATSPIDYPAWRQIFVLLWMKSAALLFFASLSLHAWIGMRNILMDYVQHDRSRWTLYVLVVGLLAAYAVWMIRILGPW